MKALLAPSVASLLIRHRLTQRLFASQRAFSSSIDERPTFSTVWQGVDSNRHDGKRLVTPDPIEYLRGFDQSICVAPYRDALLSACMVGSGDSVIDVGCGLGEQTRSLCAAAGPDGWVAGVDQSMDVIAAAREAAGGSGAEFSIADAYQLPFAEGSFDCAVADRVLQHLACPLEAAAEMARVLRPGGRLVCGDPDWRSFQLDVTGAGGFGETGRRWGESRRPEGRLDFDMDELTRRVLGGVIPRLSRNSYMGLALPRLLRAVGGLDEVELRCVPLALRGWVELERIVPITYFTQASWTIAV